MNQGRDLKLKFEEKPTKELIENYSRGIEDLLSAHNLSISITLFDKPLGPIKSFINGSLVEKRYLWIKSIKASIPKFGELSLRLSRGGITEACLEPYTLWRDAHSFQHQIYSKLNRNPGSPSTSADPYWNLWEKRKAMRDK